MLEHIYIITIERYNDGEFVPEFATFDKEKALAKLNETFDIELSKYTEANPDIDFSDEITESSDSKELMDSFIIKLTTVPFSK